MLFWLLWGMLARAEPPPPPPPPTALLAGVHGQATRTEQAGMVVLGTWAGLNLVGGVVGARTATDPARVAFHQGNAAWNVVNLGIAVPGYLSARRRGREAPAWPALPVDLARQRGVLLLNLGLDMGYVGVGTALWSLRPEDPRLRGYGQALVLQGAFLGAFDLSLITLLGRSARPLRPYVHVTPDGQSVGLSARL